ncbi:hypothetical protein B6N60_04143 [Richelia sinica FACHB-800]|uniref:Uncharacterized protein n=1 Tax=Richelia sinica FACHB-800 TaxID=1357546 RepID=A0A975TAW6_9NOST|nr:hypothetical protein [Richelia sinica]MBD2664868.1 hypothetical protein [Richelia sinica FACHB-800]QXE25428.1 hypothetical protein B6N60_04143 [Richelia sinica FACHB-800]
MNTGIKPKNHRSWLVATGCWLLFASGFDSPALSLQLTFRPSSPTGRGDNLLCSQQSLETLTTQLMLDLPSYANRAAQRSRRLRRSVDIFPYILTAGKAELQPLPLNPGLATGDRYASENVEQVFFTTLERQYLKNQAVELQQFHRLFLTKTKLGWQVVMMYTQTGEYPVKQPIAPPRESTDSAIAQGVKLWLRDCQADALRLNK